MIDTKGFCTCGCVMARVWISLYVMQFMFNCILSVLKARVLPEALQVTSWMWGHRSTRTDSSGFMFTGREAWVCTNHITRNI